MGKDRNALFYFATPPAEFSIVTEHLGKAKLLEESDDHWRRLIIEKPFGHDLPSAIALNKDILKVAREEQVFRIDHYLGKETVQNIMVFRFANGFVEPLWNRDHIDHVQITVAETVGVEQRGKSYDATGALRDMVPNHLFQLLSLIAMEPPGYLVGDALRNEKSKVLDAVHNFGRKDSHNNVVRGQYGAGHVNDKPVVAYCQSPDVPAEFDHRDLRGDEARDRQLALGGRAVLPAHRQGADAAAHRDHHPVQAGAANPVPRHTGRPPADQRPNAAHPARGRRDPALRRQGAGAGRADRRGAT